MLMFWTTAMPPLLQISNEPTTEKIVSVWTYFVKHVYGLVLGLHRGVMTMMAYTNYRNDGEAFNLRRLHVKTKG